MRATMMLADAAQEANGKLDILGGGWSVTGPKLPPMAIALKLDVPWTEANRQHEWELVLTDDVSREQMATFLVNLLDLLVDRGLARPPAD